jgi:MFS transporter, DHA1 family, multidrug resistance protein
VTVTASATSESSDRHWRRNQFAVTAASFLGFMGFTLVMPFLPIFISQLGVSDVGDIAVWTGLSLGITPAITAFLAPVWGRIADRFGRKILVERSLVSFVIIMAAMAFVTRPWHVFALRMLQGVFAGYGALTLTMVAESAPRDRLAAAIGLVQTAQRLGPAAGPAIGAAIAQVVGLRRTFFVTASFYFAALVLVFFLYEERPIERRRSADAADRVTFRSVLAFQNLILLMMAIFVLQFVDRSFGPALPLYVEQIGVPRVRVPAVSGVLFSIIAGAGALGHHLCGKLLRRYTARRVITTGTIAAAAAVAIFGVSSAFVLLALAALAFGVGLGAAMTASFAAAGTVIPPGAHGTGFGLLSGASLAALALSPVMAGFMSAVSLRAVFLADAVALLILAWAVRRLMVEGARADETVTAEDV